MGTALPARIKITALAAAAIALVLGLSARAEAIGLDNPSAAPTDTQAGAHSDFNVHLDITSPGDHLRNLTVELPPGLGGNPQAVEKCAPADFDAGNCSAGSAIGTTSAGVNIVVSPLPALPQTVNGTVYNLVPNPGEPARLGIELNASPIPLPAPLNGLVLPPIRSQVQAALRPGDFGLNTILTDLPKTATVALGITAEVQVTSLDLSLDQSFMFNPTSCNEAVTNFVASSWDGDTTPVTAEASFTPTGCENQAFSPHATMLIDGGSSLKSGDTPTVVTSVTQGSGEANTKHVELTLPRGLGPVFAVLLGTSCPQASFAASGCPAATKVGSAVAESPLLASPLQGSVYLVTSGSAFPNIGIDLKGDLNVQLQATAGVASTGVGQNRVVSILDGLPDLPLSKFDLTFAGGPGALFATTTDVCAPTARLEGSFDSHGGQHVTTSSKPVVKGCGPTDTRGATRSVRCGGRRATKVGTRGRNLIRGTRKRDVIAGLGGNDVIRGLGGKDILCGGKGRDRLAGGAGKDKLVGGKGRDSLFGGAALDRLMGGRGRDQEIQ